ncbi:MAG: heparan-alpha-glucosaminide N-acetyltransferase domain-containing protein [Acutalibacter sp.]
MSPKGNRPHYGLLDTVRGVCILSMVAYHGMYDLVDIFGLPSAWYTGLPGYIWQQSICWTFILLSGMCWQLSRHHVKRGLLLVGCGAAISLITWLAMPSQRILYGVLNLLGLSALLLIPLDKLFRKVPAWAGLGGALLLFALTKNVSRGSLGFEGLVLCQLPSWLYVTDLLAVAGFPSPGFWSTDYFPLLPWFFLFCAGYFLWRLLSQSERAKERLASGVRPLSFLGRHSLIIYLAHQPVLMGVFLAVGQLAG